MWNVFFRKAFKIKFALAFFFFLLHLADDFLIFGLFSFRITCCFRFIEKRQLSRELVQLLCLSSKAVILHQAELLKQTLHVVVQTGELFLLIKHKLNQMLFAEFIQFGFCIFCHVAPSFTVNHYTRKAGKPRICGIPPFGILPMDEASQRLVEPITLWSFQSAGRPPLQGRI